MPVEHTLEGAYRTSTACCARTFSRSCRSAPCGDHATEELPMFAGFQLRHIAVSATDIALRLGGQGPPLLLLHGYPQTHAMWHRVAPALAAALHRGLPRPARLRRQRQAARRADPPPTASGPWRRTWSRSWPPSASSASWSPGTTAAAASRTACASTTPQRVERAAVLDIVPTRTMFQATNQAIARATTTGSS